MPSMTQTSRKNYRKDTHRSILLMKRTLAKTSTWLCAAAALAPLSALRADTATFTLETASLSDVRQAMNSGALTSVDLVTMYLNRRNVYDQSGMKLNSVVQINPNVFAEA